MSSSDYEGYDWFAYLTCRGMNKEEIVKEILPHCERKTSDIVVVDGNKDAD